MGKISWYRINKTPGLYRLKSKAHDVASKIWNYNNLEERREMYHWIRTNAPKAHIAHMTANELRELIQKLELYRTQRINRTINKINRRKLCPVCVQPQQYCLCKPGR